jgi:crotonobetainyl-CoA:carnitine CoA-transferase CaiB-like acyl-CoA transferase
VRVLDFGRYIAGPLTAALLADFGADVIRVERRGGGEDRYVYPVTPDGDGAMFLQMNRNKRGITLDPKTPGGAGVLRRLAASADVVVANLPSEALRELGLDYDSLRAVNPAIILAATSAFGPDGPYAQRVGFDGIGQAMSGSVYLSGEAVPTKAFASWVDFTTGLSSAFGVMAALMARTATGRGQEVQTSLFAAALSVMNFPIIEQAMVGADRVRTGNRAQSGAPADVFQTRDGWIAVQVIGDPLFRRWARLIGAPECLEDPRFASDALRSRNGAVLSARMARWCAERTTAEALEALAAARLPGGPILSPADVLADAHVNATGLFRQMAYPGAPTPVPLVLGASTLSETPPRLSRPPPQLGEHTDEVLAQAGFTPADIADLRAAGAV